MLKKIKKLSEGYKGSSLSDAVYTINSLINRTEWLNELIDNLPNEIIEMLRCPKCMGIGHPLSEGQPVQLLHCQTCNGSGIRLPEKVEEKSCGNCKFEPLAENSPCNSCDDVLEMANWQPKEQSEDLTEIKLSKEDFQQIQESIENPQYNEKLAEALKRPLGFEQEQSEQFTNRILTEEEMFSKARIEQLQAELSEKDKEIAELKAERDKYERADLLVYLRDDFECVDFPEIINAIEMFDAVVKVESITKQALKEG